jgi:antitoxin component YwqK of YwqJK toxin-antitoxin module
MKKTAVLILAMVILLMGGMAGGAQADIYDVIACNCAKWNVSFVAYRTDAGCDIWCDESVQYFPEDWPRCDCSGKTVIHANPHVLPEPKPCDQVCADYTAYEVIIGDEFKPPAAEPKNLGMWGFSASWTPVEQADGYYLDVSENIDFTSYIAGYEKKAVTGTSHDIKGLSPGKTYFFRVRAFKTGGSETVYSNIAQADLPQSKNPVAQSAQGIFEREFTAIWENFGGAEGYLLDISAADDFSSFITGYESKSLTGTAHTVTGLVPGNTYFYRLRAFMNPVSRLRSISARELTDNSVMTGYSNIIKVNLSDPPPPPEYPPPIGCILSNSLIPENTPAGTEVGTFTGIDADPLAKHTFAIISSTTSFIITGNVLKTAALIEYPPSGYLSIRVQTTNSNGKSREDVFNIDVLWSGAVYTKKETVGSCSYEYAYYKSPTTGSIIKHGAETVVCPTGRSELTYEKGKLHGIVRVYYPNGIKAKEFDYKEGVPDGSWNMWTKSGKLYDSRTYLNGNPTGVWKSREYFVNIDLLRDKWVEITFDSEIRVISKIYRWVDDNDNEYSREERAFEYQNGKLVKTVYNTYSGGKLEETFTKDAHNLLTGPYIRYDSDGVVSSRYEYVNGIRHGAFIEDRGNIKGSYENGMLHGSWEADWGTNKYFGQYNKDVKTGTWTSIGNNCKTVSNFKDGRLNGSFQSVCTGQSKTMGYYTNNEPCGRWTYIYYGEQTVTNYADHGLCGRDPGEPSAIVTGRVTDAKSKLPVKDAEVCLGTECQNTVEDGFYSFSGFGKGNHAFKCAKEAYHTDSATLSLTNTSYIVRNIVFRPLSDKPFIKKVLINNASDVKLLAADKSVEISAEIAWDGAEVDYIEFDLNGRVYSGVSPYRSFNLAADFVVSGTDLKVNTLKITAANKSGQVSDPVIVHPVVLPVPEWIQDLGTLEMTGVNYGLSAAWPEEPAEILINQKKLGVLWNLWCVLPLVGCRDFGLPPSQAAFEIGYGIMSGEGEIMLSGQTGFRAAGGQIFGKIGGKGEFEYKPGEGLAFTGGSLIMGIGGEITKTVGPITLIPALESAVEWPLVGRAVNWFNEKVTITGKIGADANLAIGLLIADNSLGFKNAGGDIGNTIGLALAVDIYILEAELSADADTRVYWQFPADPDYLEKFEAKLTPQITLSKWGVSESLSAEFAYTWPDTARSAQIILGNGYDAGQMKPVPRDFIFNGNYNSFAGVRDSGIRQRNAAAGSEETVAEGETRLIENVYPYAEPAIALNGSEAGIAYTYFDPEKADLQATEIYLSYFDGKNYSVPAPVQTNTRAEFSPNIAFDRSGNLIAVWERVKNENLTDTGADILSSMAKEMEIVYAVYHPINGTWTEPTALTDNTHIDHKPVLKTGRNGEVMVMWIGNAGNEMIGTAAYPDKLYYAFWDGVSFGPVQTVPQDFADCMKYTTAFDGRNMFIAYIKDKDGNLATPEDEELFYLICDGTEWSIPVQLTDDTETDDNPQMVFTNSGYPELVWLKGNTLARLTDWNTEGVYQIIRGGSDSAAFTDFRLFKAPQDRLVILWQGLNADKEPDLFYSVYDPAEHLWTKDLQMTDDPGLEKGFKGMFAEDGTLHLVFNRQKDAKTKASDLYHLTYKLGYDLAVSAQGLAVESETEAAPGKTVNLVCAVENKSDLPVKDVNVSFYTGDPAAGGTLLGSATAEPAIIRGGDKGKAVLSWNIPVEYPGSEKVYAVADPDDTVNETDELNNKAGFYPVKPDMEAIQCQIIRHGDNMVDIIAVLKNNGSVPAKNVKIVYKADTSILNTTTIPEVDAGAEAQTVYSVFADTALANPHTRIEITADPENTLDEQNEENNRAIAYMDNPVSPTKYDFGIVDPAAGNAVKTFTFSDIGDGLDIKTLTITGTDAADFSVANDTCSGQNPPANCTADVIFNPTFKGIKSASLLVTYVNAAKAALEIPLNGAGTEIGDVDGDGILSLSDVIMILKILAGTEAYVPFQMYSAGDVNKDGKLGTEDVVLAIRKAAGL